MPGIHKGHTKYAFTQLMLVALVLAYQGHWVHIDFEPPPLQSKILILNLIPAFMVYIHTDMYGALSFDFSSVLN